MSRSRKPYAAVVLLINPKEETVLLLLRDKRTKSYPDFWGFAGGIIDKLDDNVWEHPVQAAKREAFEETGLNPNKLFYLSREQKLSGFVYFFYCTDFEGTIQKKKVLTEHSAVAWAGIKSLEKARTIPGSGELFLKSLKLIKEREESIKQ